MMLVLLGNPQKKQNKINSQIFRGSFFWLHKFFVVRQCIPTFTISTLILRLNLIFIWCKLQPLIQFMEG